MSLFFWCVTLAIFMIQDLRIIRIKSSRDKARMWRDFHAEWSARWEAQARAESLEVERLRAAEARENGGAT